VASHPGSPPSALVANRPDEAGERQGCARPKPCPQLPTQPSLRRQEASAGHLGA
jgi:hypothetical protein